jgi:hypothetical protein
MSDKVFCGNGKEVTTKFGKLLKISFSKKDLETLMANLSEQGWVNTVVKEKKDKIEGKPTHYLELDNFKPTPQGGLTNNNNKGDDLPF